VAGGYFNYRTSKNKEEGIRYVLAAVTKDTLIISVSGSGQVASLDELEIQPKASGDITYIGIENGQSVKAGALLAQLDTTDIEKTISDAEISLQQAKTSLDKMEGITTQEGTLRGTKEKAQYDLKKAYEDGFNNVSDVFLDLPSLMSGLQDIIFSSNFNPVQENVDYYAGVVSYDDKVLQYKEDAVNKYKIARESYDQNFQDYKSASRFSENAEIEALIDQTYETTKNIAEAVKSINNLIQFYQDQLIERDIKPQTLSNTHLTTLNGYTGTTNSFLLTLLSIKNSIQSDKETIIEADFDIKDQEIKVAQAEYTLNEDKKKLADYSIYAPFDGVITSLDVRKGDSVSSGTALATIITKQKIAEISLNEVDAADVKVGQKTTLTFDALEDVSITGKVLSVDALGEVSQGVVSYGVKISFDTQNERIKPGMSVTADIITDVKQDALTLPNSAIKSQEDSKYIEFVEASDDVKQKLLASVSGVSLSNPPQKQSVEIGISNDLSTEIVSGLKEGDIVVVSTVSQSKTQTTQTQESQGFQIMGAGGMAR
jgi:HlyD family secretion protein